LTVVSSQAWHGVTVTPKLAFNRSQAVRARSRDREHSTTVDPSRASSAAARIPTGPVPPRITARVSESVITPARRATAAAAVVLQPLASIIALTRNGPKKAFWTAVNSASAAPTSVPPTHTAVCRRSAGPRVKIAPCTSGVTSDAVTPP
jgi:hypothetical protein